MKTTIEVMRNMNNSLIQKAEKEVLNEYKRALAEEDMYDVQNVEQCFQLDGISYEECREIIDQAEYNLRQEGLIDCEN